MSIFTHLHRGLALQQAGRIDEAETIYLDVLQYAPTESNAHHFLGVIYRDRGQLDKAIRSITTAITLSAAEASYYNSLGTCYLNKKEFVAAEFLFRKALDISPVDIDALCNLGLVIRELQRLDEAAQILESALKISPGNSLALCHLGNTYLKLAANDKSLVCYEQILQTQADCALAVKGKSEALFNLERYEEAIMYAERSCDLDANMIPEAMQVTGQSLEILGRNDEAIVAFDRGLTASPGSIELAYMRTKAQKIKREEPFFNYLRLYEDKIDTVGGMLKARIGYALGKAYEDVGDFGDASRLYAIGSQSARENKRLNESQLDLTFDSIKQACTPEYLASLAGMNQGSDRPIFILGMPRSGSTLIEQILASHPKILAGGELNFAQRALDQYLFPSNIKLDHDMLPDQDMHMSLLQRGQYYLNDLNTLPMSGAAQHVTDKLPGNFVLLGLIATMLPNARIIHCRRDPIDTCISCYTQLFTSGHEWTYDFATIGRYYQRYWKLMEHWRRIMPGRFLEIRYEQLVDDTEKGARQLLDWCGLPWDEQVLRFYETKRNVMTASLSQVRKPIYTSSMGRWKKWEPYIQALIDEIADIEEAYWAEIGNTVEFETATKRNKA